MPKVIVYIERIQGKYRLKVGELTGVRVKAFHGPLPVVFSLPTDEQAQKVVQYFREWQESYDSEVGVFLAEDGVPYEEVGYSEAANIAQQAAEQHYKDGARISKGLSFEWCWAFLIGDSKRFYFGSHHGLLIDKSSGSVFPRRNFDLGPLFSDLYPDGWWAYDFS